MTGFVITWSCSSIYAKHQSLENEGGDSLYPPVSLQMIL